MYGTLIDDTSLHVGVDVDFTIRRPRGTLEIGVVIKKGVESIPASRSFDEADALSLVPNL